MKPTAPTLTLLAIVASACAGCGSPNVISPERAAGGGLGGSSGPTGGGGTGTPATGQGAPSLPSPSIPDAGSSGSDTAAPAMPTSCAEDAYKAEAVPLDLMLLVDTSGSMNESAGMNTKWEIAQKALSGFVRDPRSAGLGIGLQYFPYQKRCMADADCGGGLLSCRGRSRCAPAGATTTTGALCANLFGINLCASGTTCQPVVGSCSVSLVDCLTIGQPCEANGGICAGAGRTCTNSDALGCEATSYESPDVAIGALPGAEAALLKALASKNPDGGTPMHAAAEGALKQLRAHLAKNPGRKGVLVLVSDGLPDGCNAAQNSIAAIADVVAMAAAGPPAITTYVIGAFAANQIARAQPQLDRLAMSGGTGQAFVLTATDDLTVKLQQALDTIRGAALSCEFKIPPPKTGSLDFSRVNVRYTPTAGTREDVGYVRSADKCDPVRGGWYYDVDPSLPAMGTPTRVLMCPSTCQAFKKDQSAKVDLVFGCATKTID